MHIQSGVLSFTQHITILIVLHVSQCLGPRRTLTWKRSTSYTSPQRRSPGRRILMAPPTVKRLREPAKRAGLRYRNR